VSFLLRPSHPDVSFAPSAPVNRSRPRVNVLFAVELELGSRNMPRAIPTPYSPSMRPCSRALAAANRVRMRSKTRRGSKSSSSSEEAGGLLEPAARGPRETPVSPASSTNTAKAAVRATAAT
jgi:hypothetical protein